MPTYRVFRTYQDRSIPSRTILRGLSLEEAQAHCSSPETSGCTCTSAVGRRRTRRLGLWMDCYTKE